MSPNCQLYEVRISALKLLCKEPKERFRSSENIVWTYIWIQTLAVVSFSYKISIYVSTKEPLFPIVHSDETECLLFFLPR